MPGVIRTRVGYTGGTRPNPTYNTLGDHTEAIQIDFDPSVLTYKELLETFWSAHDPTSGSVSKQYKAAVFYHDEEQLKQAKDSLKKEASKRSGEIRTEIIEFKGFTVAEDYHQKFRLRSEGLLMDELVSIYPDSSDFMNSTAVARINGYLG
ncbi:MAG: peptide-methionine (S)-S-oxide reductase [Nitrospirota bacterium]|nr:MAG: peptide-methionine (S)-S-oxide reductase [Nitrospirota bacterium]